MTLGERMLAYRARHNISQAKLAKLIGETSNTVFRCESGKFKFHKVNEIRLTNKMKELEAKENVSL